MPTKERYQRDIEYYLKHGNTRRLVRKESNLCVTCGRPLVDGAGTEITCPICIDASTRRTQISRSF